MKGDFCEMHTKTIVRRKDAGRGGKRLNGIEAYFSAEMAGLCCCHTLYIDIFK